MYLHIGDDCCIDLSTLLAILDIKVYREAQGYSLLKKATKSSALMGKEPRSVVITDEAVYFSVISAQSLKKRAESPVYEEGLHFAADS